MCAADFVLQQTRLADRGTAGPLPRFGICVNVIEPGWVRTPMTEAAAPPVREAALAETLLGELVEPEDVATAVVFLAAAHRITGQTLRVDAGQYL